MGSPPARDLAEDRGAAPLIPGLISMPPGYGTAAEDTSRRARGSVLLKAIHQGIRPKLVIASIDIAGSVAAVYCGLPRREADVLKYFQFHCRCALRITETIRIFLPSTQSNSGELRLSRALRFRSSDCINIRIAKHSADDRGNRDTFRQSRFSLWSLVGPISS